MMTNYHLAESVWQTVLLVISQFAVILLAAGSVLLFMRKCKLPKIVSMAAVLLLNVTLYVVMQLDSRITGAEEGLHLHVPYMVLMLATLLSILFGARLILSETRNRKTLSNASIKESFDNLPTGVCFFNEAGLPVLCNHAMYRFSFAVGGKDVQLITDLENFLADDFVPTDDVRKDGKVFILPDGSAWHLEKRIFTHESGNMYTQYIATDVSELHKNRVELTQENEQLRKVQADLKKLSANIVAVTREEEILNTKMRVHDEMGRCLVEAQKFLRDGCNESIPDSVIRSWQRAVSMIKYSNEAVDEDMLSQVRKTCASVGIAYVQTGELPREESTAYTLICAVRECVTNAVRYAGASELYVQFSETEKLAAVTITNNGKRPDSPIVEGGGLSTLRRRVERAGGIMAVQSLPIFKLTVTVPKEKEGVL